ncbi:MAG TPA: hypothetical protein VKT54_13875 [Steroidobacteraceae bacterium]|nr:hypothetical protein [Steroidobacteraceae bacterium]
MSGIAIIGRGCRSDAAFTREIARALGLPELPREPGETDERYLIRRLSQIQWCNRHWAHADLYALSPDLLALAAMQICAAAADYCQDRTAERMQRVRQEKRA